MKIQEKKIILACRCTLLAVVCLLAGVLFLNINANAETVRKGTVYGISTSLNFRNAPGDGAVIGSLYNGDTGIILAEQTVSGTVWYQMNVNGTIGWASSAFVKVTNVSSGQDFEKHLTDQGFPESYKAQLRALHVQYPNWIFEAHHVGLTWDEVVTAQNSKHRSLVHTNSISSWKSLEGNDYNWSTGVWAGYDTSAWVAASEGIIKYHLDPRNFLDSTYVFQFLKQSYDANMDYSVGLKTMVAGSFLAGSYTENGASKSYITTLLEAGKQSGVSPYTIAATLIQEQGRAGTSGLISGTYPGYEGYYNYYNIGAYQSGDLGPIEMGLLYAQKTDTATLRPWNTRTKAITGGSIKYGRDYVNIGQDTLYLKKFDLVPSGGLYNHQYMTNIQAAASEGKLLAGGYDATARAAGLVFKIPVYKNMPDSAAIKPTDSGKPYQLLHSITVTNGSFAPAYNIYHKEYRVTVPVNATSVTINATSKNPNAKVTGTGTIALNSDITKATVTVTVPNVSTNTYTLTIARGNKGQWIQDSVGWWYRYDDGSYPVSKWEEIGGEWYYFDARGYMVTGWKLLDNHWYYLKPSGARATGWLTQGNTTYYFDANGVMATGWQTIEGKKYFFEESGAMSFVVEGQWIQDGVGWWYQYDDGSYPANEWKQIEGKWYYFNAKGYMVTGWQLINGKWYFLESSGERVTGWLKQGTVKYYLDENGVMLTGWQTIEGKKYLFNESGVMQTGWKEASGKKYYLDENGALAIGWTDIQGDRYYFDSNGYMVTGWQTIAGKKYLFADNGVMTTGWKEISGKRYYLDNTGAMVIGWSDIEGNRYYFDQNGCMKTGWLALNGAWYYLDKDGTLLTGFYKVGGVKYYSDKNGKMVTGWQVIGNRWYYFHSSGAMATGWLQDGSVWYYLQSDGTMATGWQQIGGTWYYFYGGGTMATGWVKLGGTWYYLHGSGAMAIGWVKSGRNWYYFHGNGAMATGWLNDRGTWYYLDSSGAMVTSRYINGYYVNSNGVWIP